MRVGTCCIFFVLRIVNTRCTVTPLVGPIKVVSRFLFSSLSGFTYYFNKTLRRLSPGCILKIVIAETTPITTNPVI